MSNIVAPGSRQFESPDEGPAQAMQAQMLMLKQAHFGQSVLLSPADKMEGNRIGGLPPTEQLAAFNEWAIGLAAEARKNAQEQIAAGTRSQIELTAKLAASNEQIIELKGTLRVDSLTKALTRHALEKELEAMIEKIDGSREKGRRSEEHQRLSVLFVDIDHFKRINDTLSHNIGDAALKAFVELTKSKIRDNDIVGRYGGEEFVVVLKDIKKEDAIGKAEEIRAIMEEKLKSLILAHCPDKTKEVEALDGTVSIGITDYETSGTEKLSAEQLMKQADLAMYHSKNTGRNRITVYNPETINQKDMEMAENEVLEEETPG